LALGLVGLLTSDFRIPNSEQSCTYVVEHDHVQLFIGSTTILYIDAYNSGLERQEFRVVEERRTPLLALVLVL
jgi:hypothetical protein